MPLGTAYKRLSSNGGKEGWPIGEGKRCEYSVILKDLFFLSVDLFSYVFPPGAFVCFCLHGDDGVHMLTGGNWRQALVHGPLHIVTCVTL